ncbi:MAG: glycoside hydrolase family 2 protein [Promethearchaeota archaeon]
MNDGSIPRPEYPRPQFERENNWINLNGEWEFAFDDANKGLKERWHEKNQKKRFDRKIIVPFCFQSELSGIGNLEFHNIMWYRKEFEIPPSFKNKRILLHFGAVDYSCTVYLNEEYVGSHKGGYVGFTFDITDFIKDNNVLVVRVEDPSTDLEIPRGKQYWLEEPTGIFYQRVSGIWQTAWIERVSLRNHLKWVKITPDIDKSEIIVECDVHGKGTPDLTLSANILANDKIISQENLRLDFLENLLAKRDRKILKIKGARWQPENPSPFKFKMSIPKEELRLWEIDDPFLYDLIFKLIDSKTSEIIDMVKTYFGMRKISISETPLRPDTNKRVLLNNKPIYQKLFLIQGYWRDGLYTAPSDEAIKRDIQYIKEFGFNGLRTHQKVFDPRFLYWCDKMGILVWGEIGNTFQFSPKAQLRLLNQFVEEVERDYNHPSIIVWTILNEGWGVPGAHRDDKKKDYTRGLYYLLKSIDPTRLIIDDDGWFHAKSDLCTLHMYEQYEAIPQSYESEKIYQIPSPYPIYLSSCSHENNPVIFSEIGGFGFELSGEEKKEDWGYQMLQSSNELFEKIVDLLKLFDARKDWIHGFCYTELYDQFQEINGFLTIDRIPKFEPARLKAEVDKLFY